MKPKESGYLLKIDSSRLQANLTFKTSSDEIPNNMKWISHFLWQNENT